MILVPGRSPLFEVFWQFAFFFWYLWYGVGVAHSPPPLVPVQQSSTVPLLSHIRVTDPQKGVSPGKGPVGGRFSGQELEKKSQQQFYQCALHIILSVYSHRYVYLRRLGRHNWLAIFKQFSPFRLLTFDYEVIPSSLFSASPLLPFSWRIPNKSSFVNLYSSICCYLR